MTFVIFLMLSGYQVFFVHPSFFRRIAAYAERFFFLPLFVHIVAGQAG